MMGNHQTCLIYSAKDHCIWMRCQSFTGSVDPALQHPEENEAQPSDEVQDISQNENGTSSNESLAEESHDSREGSASKTGAIEGDGSQDNDDTSGGEEEDDADYGEDYAYDGIESRPAAEVLRDINQWYKELKAIPGGGEYSSSIWDKNATKRDAFLTSLFRCDAASRAEQEAEEPLKKLQTLQKKCGKVPPQIVLGAFYRKDKPRNDRR